MRTVKVWQTKQSLKYITCVYISFRREFKLKTSKSRAIKTIINLIIEKADSKTCITGNVIVLKTKIGYERVKAFSSGVANFFLYLSSFLYSNFQYLFLEN